jgi:hypothetical protein
MPLLDKNFVTILQKCAMGNLKGNEKIEISNNFIKSIDTLIDNEFKEFVEDKNVDKPTTETELQSSEKDDLFIVRSKKYKSVTIEQT